MQRPNPGELLAGLRHALECDVLPALPRGVPQQQLKAALHLVKRLERSWDLMPSHLEEDSADIASVLAPLLSEAGTGSLEARLAEIEVAPPAGFNDPELAEKARRNLALHQLLLEQDDTPEVIALYRRMAARDSRLVGDSAASEESGQ